MWGMKAERALVKTHPEGINYRFLFEICNKEADNVHNKLQYGPSLYSLLDPFAFTVSPGARGLHSAPGFNASVRPWSH